MAPSKQKALVYSSFAALAACACFLLWMFWSLCFPINAVDVYPDSFHVQNANKEIHRGEAIFLNIDFCKYEDVPTIHKSYLIIDGQVEFVLPTQIIPSYVGCSKLTYAPAILPSSLPVETVGHRAKVKIVASYRLSSMRTQTKTWYSEPFTILY